jgi:sigma-B regulation protein RsbU (phosphoserine phosphatase)
VLIADVSGHGSPAAMIMAILHTLTQHSPVPPDQPGAFLGYLNDRLASRTIAASGTFVTAFYAVFNPIDETVRYASAGHVPPRIVHSSDGTIHALNRAQRLPLGINPKQRLYPDETAPFRSGDTVALVTDGVTESTDYQGNCFGNERFDAALLFSDGTASHRLAEILVALDSFAGVAKDDRTILIVRHAGNQPLQDV